MTAFAKLPPHPLGLRCDTCMFWNASMKQEIIMQPDGNAIPVKAALQMGMGLVNAPRATISVCQLFPKWENTMSEAYCWHHKSKERSDVV